MQPGLEGELVRILAFVALCGALVTESASAETVDVRYRGAVDLKPFACTDVSHPSANA